MQKTMKELLKAIEFVRGCGKLESECLYTCHLLDDLVAGEVAPFIKAVGESYAELLEARMKYPCNLYESFVVNFVQIELDDDPSVHPMYREERLKWLDFLEAKVRQEMNE